MQEKSISIIIPTLNEAENIGDLVRYLRKHGGAALKEVIVVDARSQDNTVRAAEKAGAWVLEAERRRRSCQMNQGADRAGGKVLYFVHADTFPPETYVRDIFRAMDEGFPSGCYRSKLGDSPRLRFQSWLSRFPLLVFRGGDQTLFVEKELFGEIGGFRNNYAIMEDFEIIPRLRKQAPFRIMDDCARISDRKYLENSFGRVNLANIMVVTMYFLGFPQASLLKTYRRMVRGTKY